MPRKVCAEPGCPTLTDRTRCTTHERAKDRARGTRQERGYDADHDREAKRWRDAVRRGELVTCWRCGDPITDPNDCHLGHDDHDHRGCRSAAMARAEARCEASGLRLTAQRRQVLEALGPDGCFVNVARGSVADQEALVELLSAGKRGGAALDVFENEPAVPEALRNLENVVLSPHQGTATRETRDAMGELVVANLDAHFARRPLLSPVA